MSNQRITYQFFLDHVLNGTKHYTKKQIYYAYLRTDRWAVLREERLVYDKYTCRLCGAKADCVHHCKYPEIFGSENVDFLTSLCTPCHTNFHEPPSVTTVQQQFFDLLAKGKSTNCPTCKRHAKYGMRALNGTMARSLVWLVYEFRKKHDWVNVPSLAPKWLIATNQHTTLEKWELIERRNNHDDKSKKYSGDWKPTELGLRFVDGQCKVPKKVCLWHNTKIGQSEESISISDAIQAGGFNYQDVLQNPDADVEKAVRPKKPRKNKSEQEETHA